MNTRPIESLALRAIMIGVVVVTVFQIGRAVYSFVFS